MMMMMMTKSGCRPDMPAKITASFHQMKQNRARPHRQYLFRADHQMFSTSRLKECSPPIEND